MAGPRAPSATTAPRPRPAARWVAAPAKINVHLEVTGRRPDGYHAVETLMLAVNLYDTLEVTPSRVPGVRIECNDPAVPTDGRNLVAKAAEALGGFGGRGARVRLTKRIPHEAGLGGGSSDAAAALVALNELWDAADPTHLPDVAAAVGSDVPFFLHAPAAWCVGRGEVCEPAGVGGPFHWVIVKPPVGCPTGEVYRRLRLPEAPRSGDEARAALASGDANRLAAALFNRLREPAFALRPELADVAARLERAGPLAVTLCGSGSALAALCDSADAARRVAARYRAERTSDRVFVVRSLDRSSGTQA